MQGSHDTKLGKNDIHSAMDECEPWRQMPMGVITSVRWLLLFFLNSHQVGVFSFGIFLRIKQVININIKKLDAE
jgi:hypothetical protein